MRQAQEGMEENPSRALASQLLLFGSFETSSELGEGMLLLQSLFFFYSCGDRSCITCFEYKPDIAETERSMVQMRGWLCHLLFAAVLCLASSQGVAHGHEI